MNTLSAVNERKATIGDAIRVWFYMRDIDREEAEIVSRWPLVLRLIWWVLMTEVRALRRGRQAFALYGVKSMEEYQDGLGCIWQLVTHEAGLDWNKEHIYAASLAYLERCHERFPILGNAVYAKNEKALRFVKRLGFQVQAPMVVHGALFHPIARRSSCAESSKE